MSKQVKAQRVQDFGTTVFSVWSKRAKEAGAVNLGQGFPDFEPPEFVLQAAKDAMNGYQQYAPLPGMPVLREAIAETSGQEFSRDIRPDTEVTVTVGATEGIYATIQAVVDPGDEVLLIEPFYDSYPASITMAGGVPRFVPLRPNEEGCWLLDMEELEAAMSEKTKLLVLNTPHNPTGKVFSAQELENIAALCIKYDVLVLSDEVYDQIVFDGKEHISIASLPDMWERTLVLRSVGKTFSVTGWKIGWAIGSSEMNDALRMAHQWIPFSVASPFQVATASMLLQAENNGYYDDLRSFYQAKRDFLLQALEKAGLQPLTPEGTYFIMADSSSWNCQHDDDFCMQLLQRKGVVAIPPSSFYSEAHKPLAFHLARFAFCKQDTILEEAAKRLQSDG